MENTQTLNQTTQQPVAPPETGNKSYLTASLFSLIFGGLAIDRFYLGYVGLGILKLITFGGCGVWALIDAILIITGNMKDVEGRRLVGYEQNKKLVWIIAGVFYVLSFISGAFWGIASMNLASDIHKTESSKVETTQAPTTTTKTSESSQPTETEVDFTPISISGTGSKTSQSFNLVKGVNNFDLTHSGSADFIVELVDQNGTTVDHLAHATGNVNSLKDLDIKTSGSYKLKVTADGPWIVTVSHE